MKIATKHLVNLSLAIAFTLQSGTAVSDLAKYHSNVPAKAGLGTIDGTVSWAKLNGNLSNPVDSCVLQHGYVVNQDTLNQINESEDPESAFGEFLEKYYGPSFPDTLASRVCKSVYLPLHEAIKSTHVEYVERLEGFVRDVACKNADSCALYGHSKGGVAVTNFARRCMNRTSAGGEDICKKISSFYSSAGTNLGASFGIVVYGIYLTDPESRLLKQMETFAGTFGINLSFTEPDQMIYIPGLTNPVWVDLSPVAPLEGQVPVKEINDINLNESGWLTGRYSAISTNFDFERKLKRRLLGCQGSGSMKAVKTCQLAGTILPVIHTKKYRQYFEKGLEGLKSDLRFISPRSWTTDYLNDLSWEKYQVGDGLADFDLSMQTCFNGGTAIGSCGVFNDLNHAATAGGNKKLIDHVTDQLLSDFSLFTEE